MKTYINILVVISVVLLCLKPVFIQAQSKDTLAAIRKLVELGKMWQQRPLHMELEIVNTTNFITSQEDTSRSAIVYYLTEGASYINYGNIEQIVSDSMALMVSNDLQRMILYKNAGPVLTQMKQLAGLPVKDSSIRKIADRYVVQQLLAGNEYASFQLSSRKKIHASELPIEQIELRYGSKDNRPQEVIIIKRTLLPLQEEQYSMLSKQPDMVNKLVTIENKDHYFVKEQITRFVYKSITHTADIKTPVTIFDRIRQTEQGDLRPVKSYEGYAITVNR